MQALLYIQALQAHLGVLHVLPVASQLQAQPHVLYVLLVVIHLEDQLHVLHARWAYSLQALEAHLSLHVLIALLDTQAQSQIQVQ